MFESLIVRLSKEPSAPPTSVAGSERREVAVAALLVEAAHIDRNAGSTERAAVARLLRERFGLAEDEVRSLVAEAEARYAENLDDWIFAHTVRESFDESERIEVLRMLWEVVYSDGRLAAFELDLLQRLCTALDIDEEAAEGARVQAFASAYPHDPEQAGES